MSAAEVSELLGAYALGSLDQEERERVERLLERSPEARSELADHRHVAEHLGSMASTTPPHEVWDRISDRMEEGEAAPVSRSEHRRPAANGPARGSAGWMVAAAAAALAVVLGLGLIAQTQRVGDLNETITSRDQEVEQLTTDLAANQVIIGALNDTVTVQSDQADDLQGVLVERDSTIGELHTILASDPLARAAELAAADPRATLIDLAPPEVGRPQMTVVILEDGRGYVTDSDLAPLASDRTYQLWAVMEDGRVISTAVLGSEPGADTFVVDLENLSALAITEEVSGGVVTSQNDAVIVGAVDA